MQYEPDTCAVLKPFILYLLMTICFTILKIEKSLLQSMPLGGTKEKLLVWHKVLLSDILVWVYNSVRDMLGQIKSTCIFSSIPHIQF